MDDIIIIETKCFCGRLTFSKDEYVLAESVDVIQLLPVDDKHDIMTFYKPYWKVVKQ